MYFTLSSIRLTPTSKPSPVSSRLKSQPAKAQPRFGGKGEVDYWLQKLQTFKSESIQGLARIQRHTPQDDLTVAEEIGGQNSEIAWYVGQKKALLHKELINKKMDPAVSRYYREYHRALQQAVKIVLLQNGYRENGLPNSQYTQADTGTVAKRPLRVRSRSTVVNLSEQNETRQNETQKVAEQSQTTTEPSTRPRSRFIITDLDEEEPVGSQAQPSESGTSPHQDVEPSPLIKPVPLRPNQSQEADQQSSLKRTPSGTFIFQDSEAQFISKSSTQPDTPLFEQPQSPTPAENDPFDPALFGPVLMDEPWGIDALPVISKHTEAGPFPLIEITPPEPDEEKETLQSRKAPKKGLGIPKSPEADFPVSSQLGLHQATTTTPLLERQTTDESSTDVNCMKIVQDFCRAMLNCLSRRNSNPATRARVAHANLSAQTD